MVCLQYYLCIYIPALYLNPLHLVISTTPFGICFRFQERANCTTTGLRWLVEDPFFSFHCFNHSPIWVTKSPKVSHGGNAVPYYSTSHISCITSRICLVRSCAPSRMSSCFCRIVARKVGSLLFLPVPPLLCWIYYISHNLIAFDSKFFKSKWYLIFACLVCIDAHPFFLASYHVFSILKLSCILSIPTWNPVLFYPHHVCLYLDRTLCPPCSVFWFHRRAGHMEFIFQADSH